MGRTLQSYKKLFDALKGGKIHPLYFLYGPEEYIKKEFVSELIKTSVSERNRAFNLDIFHGDEWQRDAFDDRISAFPLFADRRMIAIKKFESLSTANKDFVLERIGDLPASIVCVVETSADKLDTARMKNLKKLADAQGLSFRFQYLSDDETIQRVKGRFEREGFAVDPEALHILIESVGTHLIDLVNEIEKIILSAGDDKRVTGDMVTRVVGRYRTENLFSFLDQVGSGSVDKLVKRLNRVIDSGEEPIFVLAMLIRRVVLLIQIKSILVEQGGRARSPRAMASHLAGLVSPYFVGKLVDQADRFDLAKLTTYLENLRWADIKMKSSSLPPRSLLETSLMASYLQKNLALYGN